MRKVQIFSLIAEKIGAVKAIEWGKCLESEDLREDHLARNTVTFSTTKLGIIYLN